MAVGTGNNIAGNVPMDTGISTAGAAGPGGYLNNQKDAKTASTEAQFGEIMQQIQSKYGAKKEKPREIKKTLGKDDFLRIMITQMKNQDPTNPFKAEQMAAEMAQFASVEQLQNVNQNLTKMSTANQPLERLAMTNMIGKQITLDRGRFPHVEGQSESLTYALPADASEAKITIVSEAGETVLEKDLGPLKAGENTFTWDGSKGNTLPAKNGGYIYKIEAVDAQGKTIQMNPQRQARVIGISFEAGEPVLLVGTAQAQEKVTMKNVIKIEDGGQMQMQMPVADPAAAAAAKPTNFIAFKKGEGSGNLDAGATDPMVAEALAKYQQSKVEDTKVVEAQARAAAMSAQQQVQVKAEGFPSGLSDPEQQGPVQAQNVNPTIEKGGNQQ